MKAAETSNPTQIPRTTPDILFHPQRAGAQWCAHRQPGFAALGKLIAHWKAGGPAVRCVLPSAYRQLLVLLDHHNFKTTM
jgi:hypothetical protein